MTKQGIKGILEIDQETGTISFHADPLYLNSTDAIVVLRVSNLIDYTFDPHRTLEISAATHQHVDQAADQGGPRIAPTPVLPSSEDIQLSDLPPPLPLPVGLSGQWPNQLAPTT